MATMRASSRRCRNASCMCIPRARSNADAEVRARRSATASSSPYKSVKQLKAAYGFDDLPSFLAVYYEGMSVLLKEHGLLRHHLRLPGARRARRTSCMPRCSSIPQAHTARGVRLRHGDPRHPARAARCRGGSSASGSQLDHVLPARLERRVRDGDAATVACPTSEWIVGVGLDSDEQEQPAGQVQEGIRARPRGGATC